MSTKDKVFDQDEVTPCFEDEIVTLEEKVDVEGEDEEVVKEVIIEDE